jgi:hypothetical protein
MQTLVSFTIKSILPVKPFPLMMCTVQTSNIGSIVGNSVFHKFTQLVEKYCRLSTLRIEFESFTREKKRQYFIFISDLHVQVYACILKSNNVNVALYAFSLFLTTTIMCTEHINLFSTHMYW